MLLSSPITTCIIGGLSYMQANAKKFGPSFLGPQSRATEKLVEKTPIFDFGHIKG